MTRPALLLAALAIALPALAGRGGAQAGVDSGRRTAITEAVARVAPAVVTVQTEMLDRSTNPFDIFAGRGERVVPGIGSGFLIRKDGVIVTNAHVVQDAQTIAVALRDGTTYPARLIGKDELNDLAVLRIEATDLPVAPLGNSDDLIIGEWAIAIGNPYGFLLGNPEPSVTAGVISGTGRNLVARSEGSAIYVDMIQTDAAINPGNSGGPLITAAGEVIGVNSSIFSPSGGSIGLGFAIPINRVKRVAEDLLAHGSVRRPWVGLKLEIPSTPTLRTGPRASMMVLSVVPGSPADQAGIRKGDVLEKSRNRSIHTAFDWEAELLDLRVGEELPLTIRRGDRRMVVTVTVADLPEVNAPKVAVMKELELVTVTPAIRAEKGVRSPHGALIYKVSGRVTEELGLEQGDVIVQINRTPIATASDVQNALGAAGSRTVIRMYFERGGRIYSTDFMVR
ncbi:MAG TPA: trypsin-like peptidase domain-containing protein [Gemmatimonadaceae bacterium]|nr:trypsin-like peptidase domain-containing protein [Gemmatimonadaceae bacterium]